MSPIRLRRASLDDFAALIELEYAAFSGDWISRRGWRDLLTTPSAAITLACRGADIIGSVVMLGNGSAATLSWLAVMPRQRRQGIATLLVEDALAHAARRGAVSCRLQLLHDNYPAQALFAHLGFALIDHGDDAEVMRFQRPLLGYLQPRHAITAQPARSHGQP